jgi:DNA-binding transcriptional ArsR family regulator
MVLHQVQLDEIFHALSDPTRRQMLRSLAAREQNIVELAAPFPISFPASSKHLRVLESAGLVSRSIQGREHIFQIKPAPLAEANRWLSYYQKFWGEQLDNLEAMLAADAKVEAKKQKRRARSK